MSRYTPLEGYLLNFMGEIESRRREYMPKKEAYEALKRHTGQDFGEDFVAWQQWIHEHQMSIKVKDHMPETSQMVSKFLSRKKK